MEKKLLESANPFAIVVLSQLKAMETRNDLEAYCIMNGTQINTDKHRWVCLKVVH